MSSKSIQDRIYKSRLTITYRTNIDGQLVPQKLPLRMLVLGDFTGREAPANPVVGPNDSKAPVKHDKPGDRLENRPIISIKRGTTVEKVMADLNIAVPIPSYDHQELCGTARSSFDRATLVGAQDPDDGTARLAGPVVLAGRRKNGDVGDYDGVVGGEWKVATAGLMISGTLGGAPITPASCQVVVVPASGKSASDIADAADKIAKLDAATALKASADKNLQDATAAKATTEADANSTAAQKTAAADKVTAAQAAVDAATTGVTTATAARGTLQAQVRVYGRVRIEAGGTIATGDLTGTLTLKKVNDKFEIQGGPVTLDGAKDGSGRASAPAVLTTVNGGLNGAVTDLGALALSGKIQGEVTAIVDAVDNEVTGKADTVSIVSAIVDDRVQPATVSVTVSGTVYAKIAIPLQGLDSFGPDSVAKNVPEIKRLLLLKSLLTELKSFVASSTDLRAGMMGALPIVTDLKPAFASQYPKLATQYAPNEPKVS